MGLIGGGALGLALLLAGLNLLHGNLNQDEGWYLYAAKMVSQGYAPYADFAFTQGPVMPWIYSLFYPVVEHGGVTGGRLITTLFGLAAGGLAAWTVWRMAAKHKAAAAIAVFLLITGNVYHSYFTTVVKTYALCSFFLMGGFLFLTSRRKGFVLLAGVFLALAAGTRLSAGVVLPAVGIWLLVQRTRKLDWLWFGLGGGVTLLAVFLPSFLAAYDQTVFGLLEYHSGRDPGGLASLLMFKAGFVSRFVQAYILFVLLTLVALAFAQKGAIKAGGVLLLWLCGGAMSLVHLSAAFPYDDYQVIAYPILAAALVLTILPRLKAEWVCSGLVVLLFASVALSFSSPINQEWFVRGRDRIWWQFKAQSDLQLLKEAARVVQDHSEAGSVLLTQDTYLAVESHRSVPRGMEMGPFCYYPDMPRAQAEKYHLLNKEMLLKVLAESEAPVAAFSGYGLSIESPAIAPVSESDSAEFKAVLIQRYQSLCELEHFGQAHTTLALFEQKK
jgi:hypothetical protein